PHDPRPRDEVRVVLQLGHDDLVPRLEGPPDGLRHQVDALGGAPGEDDLLAARRPDEGAHRVAGRLVALGGLLAQGVQGAVHVGVAPLGVVLHPPDYPGALLWGGGAGAGTPSRWPLTIRERIGKSRRVFSPMFIASPRS